MAALSEVRGGRTVIAYVTATRSWLTTKMSMDVIPRFHAHVRELGLRPGAGGALDLFLHSDGGDGLVPWRLISLLREYFDHVAVLVPHHAFSAATLAALGANEVVMHPMGMLGPIDPTVYGPFNPLDERDSSRRLGISVEDVSAYLSLVRDDVGLQGEENVERAFERLVEKVHPLALGNVKRITSQSGMLAGRLLRGRGTTDPGVVARIVEQLHSKLYDHAHPINRREAIEDLGLDFVVAAEPAVEDAMWALYELYNDEMKLETEWDPELEALEQGPLDPPRTDTPEAREGPPPPRTETRRLETVTTLAIESAVRSDLRRSSFEITLKREWGGKLDHWVERTADGWAVAVTPPGGRPSGS